MYLLGNVTRRRGKKKTKRNVVENEDGLENRNGSR